MARIKGIIIPTAWDESGNILSLAIATDDEKEYLIEGPQNHIKLLSLLRQEVIANGTVRLAAKNWIIQAKSIRKK